MHSSKSKFVVPALALLLLGVVFWLLASEVLWRPSARSVNPLWPDGSASGVSNVDGSEGQGGSHTLVFAGISGVPPRFIDSGKNRGQGWQEYEIREVRKGLQNDGFQIKLDWMTPARMAEEFRQKSPICTWPAEWRDPDNSFRSKPDRIYSIPLNLGGEESHKITFLIKNEHRFQKHFQRNGDLNLDSLLHDASLKTLLIRDKQYGSLNYDLAHRVTTLNSRGDQVVRKEFERSVIVQVIRDNQQLIEMLNAGHLDYILSDSIEDQDYVQAKINPGQFKSILFQTNRIQSLEDPHLTLISIACAINPIAIQAMPFINKWIRELRGVEWLTANLKYRANLDTKLKKTAYFGFSTLQSFRSQFESGQAETWYPKQQRYFPELLLFPRPIDLKERSPLQTITKQPTWFLQVENQTALIFNQASSGLQQSVKDQLEPLYDLMPEVRRDLPVPPSSHSAAQFGGLPFKEYSSVKRLTLYAHGLPLSEMKAIDPILPTLTEITVYGAGTEQSSYLIKRLPKTLQRLDFTGSSLTESNIQDRIAAMPLRALHLSNSQISESQMKTLISNLPQTLETLSLGYLRTAFSQEVSDLLATRSLPHLELLDLTNDWLTDQDLRAITNAFTSKIKILNLGLNFFTPKGIAGLLKKDLHRLEKLDLSNSGVAWPPSARAGAGESVHFPAGVRELTLRDCQLSAATLGQLNFPVGLESLDVAKNSLSDQGASQLLSQLKGDLKSLDLGQTGAGSSTLKALGKLPQLRRLEALDLSYNAIGNSPTSDTGTFNRLGSLSLKRLNLSNNRFDDDAVNLIANTWFQNLEALNLSSNPITEKGVRTLAKALPSSLKELSLGGLMSIDTLSLSAALPRGLETLNLSENLLSDRDIQALSLHLPKGLLALNLDRSGFSERGAVLLAKAMPKSLAELSLEGTPIGTTGLLALSLSLPATLQRLSVSSVDFSGQEFAQFSENLPRGLRHLRMKRISVSHADFSSLARRLPASLTKLKILSSSINPSSALALGESLPNNLRDLGFAGGSLGDLGMMNLSKHLPLSLERFQLYGVGLGDDGLREISRHKLQNLHIIEWSENFFSSKAFNSFWKTPRPFKYLELGSNPKLDDTLFAGLTSRDLRHLRALAIYNDSISDRALTEFFRLTNPAFFLADLASTRLTERGIEALLQSLPLELRSLSMRGTQIGKKGHDQVVLHAQKQASQSGVTLEIAE